MTAPSFRFDRRSQQTLTLRLQGAVGKLSSLHLPQGVDKNPFLEGDDTDAATGTAEVRLERAAVQQLPVSIDRCPPKGESVKVLSVRHLDLMLGMHHSAPDVPAVVRGYA